MVSEYYPEEDMKIEIDEKAHLVKDGQETLGQHSILRKVV